jgi:hypothetical protein
MEKVDCPVFSLYPILSRTCYPEYEESKEDTKPFYLLMADLDGYIKQKESFVSKSLVYYHIPYSYLSSLPRWKYVDHEKYDGSKYFGTLDVYGISGYSLLLSSNSVNTRDKIIELKNHLWITRATRAIFLDFTFFNPNIDIFCTVR